MSFVGSERIQEATQVSQQRTGSTCVHLHVYKFVLGSFGCPLADGFRSGRQRNATDCRHQHIECCALGDFSACAFHTSKVRVNGPNLNLTQKLNDFEVKLTTLESNFCTF